MQRMSIKQLKNWKAKKRRKPLIIRGARQVSKTWLMKKFGDAAYENVVYVNFDNNERMKHLFRRRQYVNGKGRIFTRPSCLVIGGIITIGKTPEICACARIVAVEASIRHGNFPRIKRRSDAVRHAVKLVHAEAVSMPVDVSHKLCGIAA